MILFPLVPNLSSGTDFLAIFNHLHAPSDPVYNENSSILIIKSDNSLDTFANREQTKDFNSIRRAMLTMDPNDNLKKNA